MSERFVDKPAAFSLMLAAPVPEAPRVSRSGSLQEAVVLCEGVATCLQSVDTALGAWAAA